MSDLPFIQKVEFYVYADDVSISVLASALIAAHSKIQ